MSSTTGEPLEFSPYLTIGAEYVVLSISVTPNGYCRLQIVGDDGGSPGLFEAEMFTTISDSVPSIWVSQIEDRGGLTIGPSRWLKEGFWYAYFDDSPAEMAAFEEDREIIERESWRISQ
ncbi:hypothetical protein ACFYY8_23655 [Streptosporangium sp. NPDC001559]|uniref:hypothetical protein n=1 Tax=Streptosporangium sp. NPDC001559 TaxID=3366187 RepID=UPI0036EB2799